MFKQKSLNEQIQELMDKIILGEVIPVSLSKEVYCGDNGREFIQYVIEVESGK